MAVFSAVSIIVQAVSITAILGCARAHTSAKTPEAVVHSAITDLALALPVSNLCCGKSTDSHTVSTSSNCSLAG